MNETIKGYAKSKKVKLWQVAQELGITDSYFSRKLRYALTVREETQIKDIIDILSKMDK